MIFLEPVPVKVREELVRENKSECWVDLEERGVEDCRYEPKKQALRL